MANSSKDFVVNYHTGEIVLFDKEFVELFDTGEQVHHETGEMRPTPYVNSKGRVFVSSTPMAISAMIKKPETIEETVHRILSHSLAANYYLGDEDILDADDFDVPDDIPDPVTRYEEQNGKFSGAAINDAIDRGLIPQPTPEDVHHAKSILQRAKDFLKANRTPPAQEPSNGPAKAPEEPKKVPSE